MSATAISHPVVGERIVHKTFPPIKRHTLALYCGASGDHNPIHVDIDFAKAAGFPDVFSHGMLVMAYLGQALTDAVEPGRIRSFSTRFAAIPQLGARLTCEGHVTELIEDKGEKRARLARPSGRSDRPATTPARRCLSGAPHSAAFQVAECAKLFQQECHNWLRPRNGLDGWQRATTHARTRARPRRLLRSGGRANPN